jgi:hypothetical protein
VVVNTPHTIIHRFYCGRCQHTVESPLEAYIRNIQICPGCGWDFLKNQPSKAPFQRHMAELERAFTKPITKTEGNKNGGSSEC